MTLIERLATAVGKDGFSVSAGILSFMSTDVYRSGDRPMAVVRPATVAGLQAAVRACAEAGVAMVPRGGGASYTDGYLLAKGGHVLIDTGGLASIQVDPDNAIVRVGAGVTWAALREALAPHGLRTPFWGPFSGLVATVGGSVSQNALSHGSGVHGISAQSILAIDVVLASGELMRTGASNATRHYGPDMTGLFCGDCGSLGIKTGLTLPLIALKPAFEGVSYAFADFENFARAGRLAQIEGLDDEHFGLDVALSQGQIARHEGARARLTIAAQILQAAPKKRTGIAQLLRMGLAGTGAAAPDAFMWHFMVEGSDAAEAKAKARRLRVMVGEFGREIPNSVPNFVRAIPFAPLVNILGPAGERWVPVHGVLPHSEACAFHTALTALYADSKAGMNRLGMWTGAMFSPVGPTGFLYEVALYWPGARSAFNHHMLDAAYLETVPVYPPSAEASALAECLKQDIIALFAAHGAAHFQIGRTYPYQDRLDSAALTLLRTMKEALDPRGLMNPGALGL